jgi:hypothetical protein
MKQIKSLEVHPFSIDERFPVCGDISEDIWRAIKAEVIVAVNVTVEGVS